MDTTPVILALDFDGVLHRFFPLAGESDERNAHFAFLPAFEQAVRACPRPVRILITSSWRNKYSLEAMRERFAEDIRPLIVGATPAVGRGNFPGARLAEVQAWLEAQGLAEAPWVGVDDHPELYGSGVAVVECQDGFFEREHALLLEAVADPVAYALAHPCKTSDGKLRIITGVGTR